MIESLGHSVEKVAETVKEGTERMSSFFDKLEKSIEVAKPEIEKRLDAVKSFWNSLENQVENGATIDAVKRDGSEKNDIEDVQGDLHKEKGESDIENPEDLLTKEQIQTIKDKYKKLDYSKEQIEARQKEYTEKTKACQDAETKGVGNLKNNEKGNYGEMKTDIDLLNKGYVRISGDGVTGLTDGGHRGIDGTYHNPDGHPPYLITDAKYGNAALRDTGDGKQLSETWIDNRLDADVGKSQADAIREAMLDDDVGVAVSHIDVDGNVTYKAVDSNGDRLKGQEVFQND
jgi:hypothetical protein